MSLYSCPFVGKKGEKFEAIIQCIGHSNNETIDHTITYFTTYTGPLILCYTNSFVLRDITREITTLEREGRS